jgi:hypothetical protein
MWRALVAGMALRTTEHAPFLDARERFNRELLAFVQDPAGSVATPLYISASIA